MYFGSNPSPSTVLQVLPLKKGWPHGPPTEGGIKNKTL